MQPIPIAETSTVPNHLFFTILVTSFIMQSCGSSKVSLAVVDKILTG